MARNTKTLDTSLHQRRRMQRLRDPEFRAVYEQARQEIEQTDHVIRALDALRDDLGISKAELARRVNRNPSSIRRLFTSEQARPELTLIAAIATALGAEVRLVPKTAEAKRVVREHNGTKRELVAQARSVSRGPKYARGRGKKAAPRKRQEAAPAGA